jgi:hypothetical protein
MSATTLTIDKAGLYEFPGSGATLSTRVFHLESADFVGAIVVKGRARESRRTYLQIPYMKRSLNGACGDDGIAWAQITGSSIIQVNGAGLDLALDCTAYTSGSMSVDTDDLVG